MGITRDEAMPLIEQVREIAMDAAKGDWPDFFSAALLLATSEVEADEIDTKLTMRLIRSKGGI